MFISHEKAKCFVKFTTSIGIDEEKELMGWQLSAGNIAGSQGGRTPPRTSLMGQMPGRRGSDPLQPDNWRSGSGQLRTAAPAGKQFMVLTLHRSTPLDPSSTEQQDEAGAASQTPPAGPGAVGNEVPGIGGGLLLRTGN